MQLRYLNLSISFMCVCASLYECGDWCVISSASLTAAATITNNSVPICVVVFSALIIFSLHLVSSNPSRYNGINAVKMCTSHFTMIIDKLLETIQHKLNDLECVLIHICVYTHTHELSLSLSVLHSIAKS